MEEPLSAHVWGEWNKYTLVLKQEWLLQLQGCHNPNPNPNRNKGYHGGALYMNGMITVGAESYVTFIYNYAEYAGAIWLSNGTLMVDSEANLRFSHNSAGNSPWWSSSAR